MFLKVVYNYFIFTFNLKISIMKKLLLLSALILTFCSCSSESEVTGTTQNYLGKWVREFEYQYNPDNQLTQTYDYSEETCYRMSTYDFKLNNEFIKDSYDEVNNECIRNTLRNYNVPQLGVSCGI